MATATMLSSLTGGQRQREERRIWREVTLQVVRPLRAARQPLHRRFRDVDDVFRACRDELSRPPLALLVRLTP